jgi:hypothetical protein
VPQWILFGQVHSVAHSLKNVLPAAETCSITLMYIYFNDFNDMLTFKVRTSKLSGTYCAWNLYGPKSLNWRLWKYSVIILSWNAKCYIYYIYYNIPKDLPVVLSWNFRHVDFITLYTINFCSDCMQVQTASLHSLW